MAVTTGAGSAVAAAGAGDQPDLHVEGFRGTSEVAELFT